MFLVEGEDVFVSGGRDGLFVRVFSQKASALGPFFYWIFGTFRPLLNPIF
jgi:hypothetical protein